MAGVEGEITMAVIVNLGGEPAPARATNLDPVSAPPVPPPKPSRWWIWVIVAAAPAIAAGIWLWLRF